MTPKQISAIRKGLAMSRDQFAKHLGVNRTTVWRLETGAMKAQGAILVLLRNIKEQQAGAA